MLVFGVHHLFLNRMVPMQDVLDLVWAQLGGLADVQHVWHLRHCLARLAIKAPSHVLMGKQNKSFHLHGVARLSSSSRSTLKWSSQ